MGFKLRPGTSLFGNVTFDPELGNRSPVLSGINSSYVLTQGQDLIISGSATDPDEDYINWSFEQKFEGSKIIVVGDQEDKVYVYDSSDLSTPISTLSPEGNLFSVGNGVHSDDQYIYVSSVEDTSPRRGIINIYDKNDLSATPITLTPQNYFGSGAEAQYNVGYGSYTLANYSNTFISDGDKLYISNNEIPISRSDNSGLGAYGVVYVYDKTNWSSPPVILNALDNPNAHHPANTKYFGRGFGKAISIYGSNLYVTRGYPSAPDVWDNGFFVYDINDLSATPSYFDSNVDQTTFVDRDWGHRMETTENHIFVSCYGADANGDYTGLVYAYNRSDLNQLPTAIFAPVSGINSDHFGYTLHTSEDYLIVYRRDYGSDGAYTYNGLVEIYDINTFNHVTTLNPSIEMKSDDGDARFGSPMFVSGTNLVLSVQGAKVDNIEDAGTVLIYDLSDLSSPPSQIKEENLQENSRFGSRITMSSAPESVNYSSQGITISQSNNVFTITPGEQSATFQIEFTATDSKGASTSTTSSFEYEYVYIPPSWVVVGADGDKEAARAHNSSYASGAVYVYDANDLSTSPTKLTMLDDSLWDHQIIGGNVAVSVDKIVVGVREDPNGENFGSVYVYDANNLSATPTKLTAFDGAANDQFGFSNPLHDGTQIAVTSDKIVVGAWRDADNGSQSGSVYVFDANNLSATPTKLTAFDGAVDDYFGKTVAAIDDKILVAASGDDDNGQSSGSVYVFDANNLSAQPTKLTAFDGAAFDFFGSSIVVTSDKIVIGAPSDDDNGSNSGSAYVFDANNLSATPTKLTAFDGAAGDYFGRSVTATADKIVVGAKGDDDNSYDFGSVYVFDANNLSATPTKLTAFDGAEGDQFGTAVAVIDDKIVVGAPFDDNIVTRAGSVYVFDANNLSATPTKLTAFDGGYAALYGWSIAVTPT